MYRLTTPTQTYNLPASFNMALIDDIVWTYKQDVHTIVEKHLADITVSGHSLTFTMTQEETKRFNAHQQAAVQLRVLLTTGSSLVTKITYMDIQDVLNDEVLQ